MPFMRVLPYAYAAALLALAVGPALADHERHPDAPAKNIILFLGDGMGVSTVTAARILSGGADRQLTLDTLPYTAIARTYSSSHIVTDSAAGMNALVTGEKTPNGTIATDSQGRALQTILELAEAAGKSTGVVTTTTVTHATPAACYAHVDNRNKESEIAAQLVPGSPTYNTALVDGLEVILGGGRKFFLPTGVLDEEGDGGARADGQDLVQALRDSGYTYVWNADQLAGLDLDGVRKVAGLFEPGHMEFDVRRDTDTGGEPSLAEMTAAAIRVLRKNEHGYFLMVEGGRIDHAHHGNNAFGALTETLAFDRAIRTALETADLDDTLILVTADHSHVLTIAGYPKRGESILGAAGSDARGVPYTTLGYANGPGYRARAERVAPSEDDFPGVLASPAPKDPTAPTYVQETAVPLAAETHGGEDVIIWAAGAGAERVHGVVENSRVFTWLREATGL